MTQYSVQGPSTPVNRLVCQYNRQKHQKALRGCHVFGMGTIWVMLKRKMKHCAKSSGQSYHLTDLFSTHAVAIEDSAFGHELLPECTVELSPTGVVVPAVEVHGPVIRESVYSSTPKGSTSARDQSTIPVISRVVSSTKILVQERSLWVRTWGWSWLNRTGRLSFSSLIVWSSTMDGDACRSLASL